MSRRTDLQNLIELNTRYLQKLKEQQAVKGVDAAPGLLIEIEDKEAEIERLQEELATLEPESSPVIPAEGQARFPLQQIGLIGALGLGLVCVVSLGVIAIINNMFSTPTATPMPTPIISIPDTPTPPPLLGTPTPTSRPLSLTITPNPACTHSGTQIFQPNTGTRVVGVAQVIGIAVIDDFDYYKFEFRPPNTPDWNFINRFDDPVMTANVLGTWNTTTVPAGEYEFRLVVVDSLGNWEPCVIRLVE